MLLIRPLALILFVALLIPSSDLPAQDVVGAVEAEPALVVGIFPRRNPTTTMTMFSPLAEYISEQLGREVRVETGNDFADFWTKVQQGRYDLVHYNQYHYVRSRKETGYRVILKNEEFGRDTIAGTIVVRADSGLDSVRDLKGGKVVFGGGYMAMQSHILARYLLMQGGLEKGDYFGQYALTPPKACIAVFYNQAAAAGAGDHVLQLPVVTQQIDASRMRYLAVSEPLTHLPWAVSAEMSEQLASQIQVLMSDLKHSEQGRRILKQMKLTGLNISTDPEYDRHREIILSVLGEKY